MIPTPKQRFLDDKSAAKRWRNVTETADFQRAVDHALMQFAAELPDSPNPQIAASAQWAFKGAQAFARILQHLANENPPKPSRLTPTLNFNA